MRIQVTQAMRSGENFSKLLQIEFWNRSQAMKCRIEWAEDEEDSGAPGLSSG